MAYIGSAEDARRIRKQQEQREKEKNEFEEKKKQAESGAGLREFGAGTTEVLEAHFKEETVGLVTREEFLNKRNTLKGRLEEEKERKKRQAEAETAAAKAERQKKKARLESKAKLSFVEEEPEEEEEDKKEDGMVEEPEAAAKLGKNPNVDTEFLPDRDRAKKEEEIRKQIQEEYELRQQVLQAEPLEITYSYFDGASGHRRVITVKRGHSIGEFLTQVRTQLAPDFKAIRNIATSNLLYVKEDIILPHTVTLHDLIRKKARGKSGPLFHFDVHDDVRLEHDARLEKNESHAGKVVERSWYQRNKHVFPASRWELFDPNKAMQGYTVK